jgi:hypothetical protein
MVPSRQVQVRLGSGALLSLALPRRRLCPLHHSGACFFFLELLGSATALRFDSGVFSSTIDRLSPRFILQLVVSRKTALLINRPSCRGRVHLRAIIFPCSAQMPFMSSPSIWYVLLFFLNRWALLIRPSFQSSVFSSNWS